MSVDCCGCLVFGTTGGEPPVQELCDDTPVAIMAGAAGAPGISGEASRCDHVHPVPVAAAGTLNIGDASAAGVAVTLARSDHQHAFPAPTVIAVADAGAAALGVSTVVAREDHKHNVPTAAPVSVAGNVNGAGVATTLARSDHQHALALEVRDEGIAQGVAFRLDVVGAGASIAVAGNVATLTVPGGAGAITNTQVTALGSATENLATYTVAPGMTFLLAAGTWLVLFSTEQRQNVNLGTTSVAIFSAGVIVAHTEREQLQLAQAGEWHHGQTQAVLTFGVATTVDARFKTSAIGTQAEVRRRSLIAVKLA